MRFNDWLVIVVWMVVGKLSDITNGRHLTTDPKCRQHRPVRPGSRLARLARDVECERCMVRRAFGWDDPAPAASDLIHGHRQDETCSVCASLGGDHD